MPAWDTSWSASTRRHRQQPRSDGPPRNPPDEAGGSRPCSPGISSDSIIRVPPASFDPHYSEADARGALDAFVERTLTEDRAANVERRVVCDLPAHALLDAASDADLLVLGSRDLPGIRLVAGSHSSGRRSWPRSPTSSSCPAPPTCGTGGFAYGSMPSTSSSCGSCSSTRGACACRRGWQPPATVDQVRHAPHDIADGNEKVGPCGPALTSSGPRSGTMPSACREVEP